MIKILPKPIIARLLKRKTCATLILTNANEVPVNLLNKLNRIAFMSDMVNDYKDIIYVIPLGDIFTKLWNIIVNIASYSKEEYLDES